VALAANGGANAVRDDFDWNSMEPTTKGVFDWSASDRKMTYAANHGLHMLMILDGTPGWAAAVQGQWSSPPVDPADYGDMAGALTARYGATGTFWAANPTLPKVLPAGIELWNEENTSRFWGGLQPDPVKYTAMVKAAYPAVKGHDPSMVVLTGGLAPVGGYNDANCNGGTSGTTSGAENGLNYLQAMYANGAAGSFDAVGWHPYNFWSGATAVQMLAYHPCSAWSQMADTPVSVRSLMTANGDSVKKIWSTEFGASSCIAGAAYRCVTETEQANLATNSMVLWKGFSWSGGYYWYDVRDDFGGTSTTNDEAHFGAVRGDGSLKPSYSTLKTAWSQ
jgi:polysaccharide biosynthesis protein PslG